MARTGNNGKMNLPRGLVRRTWWFWHHYLEIQRLRRTIVDGYLLREKVAIERPRLRSPDGQIPLETYEKLKQGGGFPEELLAEVLRGMSVRRYVETVTKADKAFDIPLRKWGAYILVLNREVSWLFGTDNATARQGR